MLSWPSVNPLEMSRVYPLLPNVQVSAKTQFWTDASLCCHREHLPSMTHLPGSIRHIALWLAFFSPPGPKKSSVLAGKQQRDILMETVHWVINQCCFLEIKMKGWAIKCARETYSSPRLEIMKRKCVYCETLSGFSSVYLWGLIKAEAWVCMRQHLQGHTRYWCYTGWLWWTCFAIAFLV